MTGRQRRFTGAVLLLGLALGSRGPVQSRADDVPASIVVETDPSDARIEVDGEDRGMAPLDLALEPGSHRIRVSRDGYLTATRTVTLRAGQSRALRVTLQPVRGSAAGRAKGGGSKWVWIGAGAAAVAGGAVALAVTRGADAGTIAVDPAITGLAGATEYTFRSQGAAGGAVEWDFGDGETDSGVTVTHVYARAGSFTVTARVGTEAATAMVTVRDLAGAWSGTVSGAGGTFPVTFNLVQAGALVTGTYGDADGPGSVTGTVGPPRDVRLTVLQARFQPVTFTGSVDDGVAVISGTIDLSFRFTLRR